MEEIVSKIKQLNGKGVFNFIITGHSQGAAIAQLLRAYLEHAPDSIVDRGFIIYKEIRTKCT